MKAICVDDEQLVLEETAETLRRTGLFTEVISLGDADAALSYVGNGGVDIAFLDINMGRISGMELARKMKTISPQMHIVFVTGYSEYALDAFQVHASGYLLKPVTEDAICEQMNYISSMAPATKGRRFNAQTFGNFEFYIDNKPVNFSCAKAKELLAYLVDRRGAAVSTGEAAAVLFEESKNEKSAKAGVRNALAVLKKIFRQANAGELLIRNRATIALDTTQIDCDYYAMLEGDVSALNAYMGEYMTQYSWAEVTLAGLSGFGDKG